MLVTMFTTKVYPLIIKQCKNARSFIHTSSVLKEDVKFEKCINQVTLLGRVGNDPQTRGSSERPVVTFSLATNNNYKYESGDMLQRTDWHRISVFRPHLRESVSMHLKKGHRVYVSGKLNYGEIQMEDGNIRPTTSIIADDVVFLAAPFNKPE